MINLLGELTLGPATHPFEVAEDLVEDARKEASVVVVDFHAEATSEKIAMARMLDGKVTAVLGTHTHVQTNDARVLAGGTAAVTDVGMTGPHDSVIGVEAALAIRRMRTQMPVRFHPAEAGVRLEGALVECDGSGRATSCELVRVRVVLADGEHPGPRAARRQQQDRSRTRTSHDASGSKSSRAASSGTGTRAA